MAGGGGAEVSRRDGRSHCQSQRYLSSSEQKCWPWQDYILAFHVRAYFIYVPISTQSKPRSVQSSRWDGAILLMTLGTSCLATFMLSLWDKRHSPR
jgi:hypothetical protein